jgi:hypothetical protein
VSLAAENVHDVVRDVIARNSLALTRMERRRSRLEDLFEDSAISGAPR